MVLVAPELLSNLLEATNDCDIPNDKVLVFDDVTTSSPPTALRSWKSLLEHGEQDWERFDDIQLAQMTTACRLYSSGTTALPKAAALSHYNRQSLVLSIARSDTS